MLSIVRVDSAEASFMVFVSFLPGFTSLTYEFALVIHTTRISELGLKYHPFREELIQLVSRSCGIPLLVIMAAQPPAVLRNEYFRILHCYIYKLS
jgi:hypothetical protein